MGLIPMIFYGLVSGIALVLETAWRGLRAVGIEIPLPEAIQEPKMKQKMKKLE